MRPFWQRVVKSAIHVGLRRCGFNALVRRIAGRRLAVLCYHSVVSDDLPCHDTRTRVALPVSQFRAQLEFIVRNFSVVSSEEVLRHVESTEPLPIAPVLITFDDGFRNNLQFALPELERLGLPALFHLTAGYIGSDQLLWPYEIEERVLQWQRASLPMPAGSPDVPIPADSQSRATLAEHVRETCKGLSRTVRNAYLDRLRDGGTCQLDEQLRELHDFLSWDDIRELVRRGFAVGSHTLHHPILSRLPRAELMSELLQSKSDIEQQTGRACECIAYPNGGRDDVSSAVIAAAAVAGYRLGFTLTGRVQKRRFNPLQIDRVCVVRGMTTSSLDGQLGGAAAFWHSVVPRRQAATSDRRGH